MSQRKDLLALRHSNLLARCAIQRRQLAETSAQIEQQLGGVDRGIGIVRHIVARPMLVVGGIAVVALVGPRRVLGWISQGLLLFTAARRVMRMVRS